MFASAIRGRSSRQQLKSSDLHAKTNNIPPTLAIVGEERPVNSPLDVFSSAWMTFSGTTPAKALVHDHIVASSRTKSRRRHRTRKRFLTPISLPLETHRELIGRDLPIHVASRYAVSPLLEI